MLMASFYTSFEVTFVKFAVNIDVSDVSRVLVALVSTHPAFLRHVNFEIKK